MGAQKLVEQQVAGQLLGPRSKVKQVRFQPTQPGRSGSQPGATDTTLDGEVGTRQAVTAASSSGSKTARFTATFAAGWHSSAGAYNISNIGLFNSVSTGTLFAGNTYASSSCASNQAVNVRNWRHLLATVESKLRKFGERLAEIIEKIPSQAAGNLACGRV